MSFEAYIEEPIKASKEKDTKLTKKHQATKGAADLGTHTLVWLLTKRFVVFIWRNKTPITVNAFLVENGFLIVHYTHFFK